MKGMILCCAAFLCCCAVNAQTLANARLGIALTLPEGWEQVEVLPSSQPVSIFEAIRTGQQGEFLTVVVQPSKEKPPESSGATQWGQDMAEVLGLATSKCTLEHLGQADWYHFEGKMTDGSDVLIFHTIQSFHTYDLSFVSPKGSKKFRRDAVALVTGIVFTRPAIFEEINRAFGQMQTDPMTGLKVPAGYRLTDKFTRKEVPAYVFATYQSLFKTKSTEAVLISDDYFHLPFCANVVFDENPMDSLTMTMVGRVTARRFENDQIPYQEISLAPWPKAPQQVFLYQFRLLKPEGATIHYIFYVLKGDRQHILKVQMPDGMEQILEGALNRWLLANLE